MNLGRGAIIISMHKFRESLMQKGIIAEAAGNPNELLLVRYRTCNALSHFVESYPVHIFMREPSAGSFFYFILKGVMI